ncbi:acyl-CoA dehydrogenase family member 9 [Dictyocaulus viviparus]|uniref:Very long-chain specific acyl-CoA dehydrogenase, mitochondrial n=1 Tax=Dictyocaulus viviparus TaxID=29172 RepID=A0A0D8XXS2_DICVI|nr:acyl-CoA dehydrogenase family member 9 [Dictyocaulus viviparus]
MLSILAKSPIKTVIQYSRKALLSTAAASKKEDKVPDSQSFCMNLFRGRAVTEQVFPYPLKLDDDRRETLQMILGPTEKFLEEVNDVVKNDQTMEIPKEVLAQFAELGAFGAVVPTEYEGAGMNNSQMARLAEIVGAHDLSLGVVMGAHQSIGYKGILLFGTDSQKAKYLPDLATGRKFAAFCLTEPTSGSDANSIRSRAEKSPDGKHYILNGGKIWISNGGFADVFTVFAQTPIKMPDGNMKDKVSAFIVERAFGGVTSGPQEKKMGIKGSNTVEVHFDNVKVPVENLLGTEGEGFKVAMNILNNGRFGIPAACTGAMKYCIQKTVDHITNRVQFGQTLQDFFNVQEKLANMVARHYATESIVYLLSSNMDRGVQDYQLEAAIGKVVASENAWWVCDEAIQLHGGMGFMTETGLERVLRDLRIFRIFEGANDVMRLFVALTGVQYAGKHLQHIAKEIKSGGISTLLGQVVKRATGGSTGSNFASVVDPALTDSASNLDACIKEFGKTVENLLIKYRKEIIDKQYELIRVADAAIDIYCMIATLSRCTHTCSKNASSAAHEKDIAKYFCSVVIFMEKRLLSRNVGDLGVLFVVDSNCYESIVGDFEARNSQASSRAMTNLKQAAGGSENDVRLISSIASAVCKNGGLPQNHPVDV